MRSAAISSALVAVAVVVYLAATRGSDEQSPDMLRTAELRSELLSSGTSSGPALVSELEVPSGELVRAAAEPRNEGGAAEPSVNESVSSQAPTAAAPATAVAEPELPAAELLVEPFTAPSLVTPLPTPRGLPLRPAAVAATPSDEEPSVTREAAADPAPDVRPPGRRGPVTIRGGGSIYDDCAAHTHPRSIGASPPRGGAMVNNRIPTRGGFPIGGIRGR